MKPVNYQDAFPCLSGKEVDMGETAVLYILRVADLLTRIGDSKVFGKTLTQAQFNILMILKRHEQGGMSQKDILANLVSTKGNVSIHISNLMNKGYIRRKTSKTDGRMHVIRLTAKGKRALEALEPAYVQHLKTVTDDLSPEQAGAAIEILDQLRKKCDDLLNSSDIPAEEE